MSEALSRNARWPLRCALLAALSIAACKLDDKPPAQPIPPPAAVAPTDSMAGVKIPEGQGDLYATFQTSLGDIVVKLYEKEAPKTVANFVGLANGSKTWTDPRTREKQTNKPLYDGTLFHRVIPGFMIQGGDPLGTGVGDPGYRFEDETNNGKVFSKPGLLAMANAGPNTNGSQFFITEQTPTYLNGRHTIFGEVVKGQELVPRIAAAGNRMVTLKHVEVVRAAAAP